MTSRLILAVLAAVLLQSVAPSAASVAEPMKTGLLTAGTRIPGIPMTQRRLSTSGSVSKCRLAFSLRSPDDGRDLYHSGEITLRFEKLGGISTSGLRS